MPANRQRAPSQERKDNAVEPRRIGSQQHLKLPKLTSDNFDVWDRSLQDILYALGWDKLYQLSLLEGQRADEDDIKAIDRRAAWGLIKLSLNDDLAAKVDGVKRGEVEELLRAITTQYYKATVQTKHAIRRRLEKAALSDFHDLGAYIAFIKLCIKRLSGMGMTISSEDHVFRLLEGLPDDYEPVKQVIKIPRDPALTLAEITFLLEDFADNPRVAGSRAKTKPRDHSVLSTQSKPQGNCFAFAKGTCKRGDACRYKHVSAPAVNGKRNDNDKNRRGNDRQAPTTSNCTYCKKKGTHTAAECRSKKADEAKGSSAFASVDDVDDMAFPIFDIACATQSLVFSVVNDEMTFLIDGGSNCVVVVTAKVLSNVRPANIKVKVGGGVLTCLQIGDLIIRVPSPDGSKNSITLHDARVLPTFGINIIPECVFYRRGCAVTKCVPHLDIVKDGGRGAGVLRAKLDARTELFFCQGEVKVDENVRDVSASTIATSQARAQEESKFPGTIPVFFARPAPRPFHIRPVSADPGYSTPSGNIDDSNAAFEDLDDISRNIDSDTCFSLLDQEDYPDSDDGDVWLTDGGAAPCVTSSMAFAAALARPSSGPPLFDISCAAVSAVNRNAWPQSRIEALRQAKHARALAAYEAWYQLPAGTATIAQVRSSSAGIYGWSNTDISNFSFSSISDASSSCAELPEDDSKDEGTTSVTSGPRACGDVAYPARAYQHTHELVLMHERLGHRNFHDVARLIGVPPPKNPIFCRPCVEGKSQRHALRKRDSPLHAAPRPGYLLNIDAAGPFSTTTRGGNRYLIVHVDQFSKYIFASMETTTANYHLIFADLVRRLEAELGREGVVAQMLADGGTYFEKSVVLQEFCRKKGIVQLFSPPYTQSLNGVAERTMRTIVEMARTMLCHSGMPRNNMYGEAMLYAVYIINRLPRRAGEARTRLEYWTGRPTHRAHRSIRTWGSLAMVHQAHKTGPRIMSTSWPPRPSLMSCSALMSGANATGWARCRISKSCSVHMSFLMNVAFHSRRLRRLLLPPTCLTRLLSLPRWTRCRPSGRPAAGRPARQPCRISPTAAPRTPPMLMPTTTISPLSPCSIGLHGVGTNLLTHCRCSLTSRSSSPQLATQCLIETPCNALMLPNGELPRSPSTSRT